MTGRRALITGITGQDGVFLAQHLLRQGYEVHGMVRAASRSAADRIEEFGETVQLHTADLTDQSSLVHLLDETQPHELYNFAAQSSVSASFDKPLLTGELNALSVVRLLEAVRQVNPRIRFCQASSSEMFECVEDGLQNEQARICPRNPYGVAKVYGHWITVNYRDKYGLFACSAILFNHESPRRSIEFVTRKISLAAARIKLGLQQQLVLGNLDSRRDWGFAGDFVRAMWRMLAQDEPDDYVVATGESHSVKEFCQQAFEHVQLNWEKYVVVDQSLCRHSTRDTVCGDASRARQRLDWRPEIGFADLVRMMVEADLRRVRDGEV